MTHYYTVFDPQTNVTLGRYQDIVQATNQALQCGAQIYDTQFVARRASDGTQVGATYNSMESLYEYVHRSALREDVLLGLIAVDLITRQPLLASFTVVAKVVAQNLHVSSM